MSYMAGRQLDALVATTVLGWRWVKELSLGQPYRFIVSPTWKMEDIYTEQGIKDYGVAFLEEKDLVYIPVYPDTDEYLPHFSTDLGAAMQLFEKAESGELYRSVQSNNKYHVRCLLEMDSDHTGQIEGEYTLPMALCLAALEAYKGE